MYVALLVSVVFAVAITVFYILDRTLTESLPRQRCKVCGCVAIPGTELCPECSYPNPKKAPDPFCQEKEEDPSERNTQ